MKKILFFIVLMCLYIKPSMAENECLSVDDCKNKLEIYKRNLNVEFKNLVKSDTEKITINSFEKSQILWNKFIKEDCQFMNSPMQMTLGDGYIIVYYECLVEYYKLRINQVRKMSSDLKK